MNNRDNNLGFLGGIISGVVIGWLIAATMGDEKNQRIKDRVMKLKNKVQKDNGEEIKEIFGSMVEDGQLIYRETKNRLKNNLRKLNRNIDEIDETDYIETVQDTIREIQDRLTLSDDQAERLQNFLEKRFNSFKKELRNWDENL